MYVCMYVWLIDWLIDLMIAIETSSCSVSVLFHWLSEYRLLKLAHAEYSNCTAHKDIEADRRPKTYVLVKEVTKEVRTDVNSQQC